MGDGYYGVANAATDLALFVTGHDEVHITVQDVGDSDRTVTMCTHVRGVNQVCQTRITDTSPPVVILRAVTPVGYHLTTVDDHASEASGTFTREGLPPTVRHGSVTQ